jgi:hypothetical protein
MAKDEGFVDLRVGRDLARGGAHEAFLGKHLGGDPKNLLAAVHGRNSLLRGSHGQKK